MKIIPLLLLFITNEAGAATMPEDLAAFAGPLHASVEHVPTPSNSVPIDNPPDSLVVSMLREYQHSVHGDGSPYALGLLEEPDAETYVDNILGQRADRPFVHSELAFLKAAHAIAFGSDGNEEDTLLVLAFRAGGIFRIRFSAPAPPGTSAEKLRLAKEAFSRRDDGAVRTLIRESIETGNGGEDLERALAFAREVNTATKGTLVAAEMPLPKLLRGLTLRFRRTLRRPVDDHRYSVDLHLSGLREKTTSHRLTRYPGETMLDLAGGIGAFEDNLLSRTDTFSRGINGTQANGLYRLDITAADGERTEGYFVVTDAFAGEDPQVSVPTVSDTTKEDKHGEIFHTSRPEFRFADFRSSLFQAFQARSLSLGINFHPPGGLPFRNILAQRFENPSLGSFSTELTAGEYRLQLIYGESQACGDLIVSRDAETISAFDVE